MRFDLPDKSRTQGAGPEYGEAEWLTFFCSCLYQLWMHWQTVSMRIRSVWDGTYILQLFFPSGCKSIRGCGGWGVIGIRSQRIRWPLLGETVIDLGVQRGKASGLLGLVKQVYESLEIDELIRRGLRVSSHPWGNSRRDKEQTGEGGRERTSGE